MTNFIKNQRKLLQLTQMQLAQRTGVSHVTISDWERGSTTPKGKSLLRLAAALKVDVDTLLSGLFNAEHAAAPVESAPYFNRCGSIIRALRENAGLSQPALAKIIGFSDVSVYKWEAAKVEPKLDSLIALSRVFGVNMLDAIMDENCARENAGQATGAYQQGYQDGQAALKAALQKLIE